MKRFEYEITRHSSDEFTEVVYFCSGDGRCNVEKIPVDQLERIETVLNQRGQKGWELVQVIFGKDGLVVFWRREIKENDAHEIDSHGE